MLKATNEHFKTQCGCKVRGNELAKISHFCYDVSRQKKPEQCIRRYIHKRYSKNIGKICEIILEYIKNLSVKFFENRTANL